MRKGAWKVFFVVGTIALVSLGFLFCTNTITPKGTPRIGSGMVNTDTNRIDYGIRDGKVTYVVVFDRPVGSNFSGKKTTSGFNFSSADGYTFEIAISETEAYSGGMSYSLSRGNVFLVQLGKLGANTIAQSDVNIELAGGREDSQAIVGEIESFIANNEVAALFLGRTEVEQVVPPKSDRTGG